MEREPERGLGGSESEPEIVQGELFLCTSQLLGETLFYSFKDASETITLEVEGEKDIPRNKW